MSRSRKGGAARIVGLVPAAGQATRLGPLPVPKELLPVAFLSSPQGPEPRVAIHYLLDAYTRAGIDRAFVVLDREKTAIPRFLGAGPPAGPRLAYVTVERSRSLPETLVAASPFVDEAVVALGFPDVFFQPAEAFSSLLARQAETGADLVLGCFPTQDPSATDMVDLAPDGRVRGIEVRPPSSRLTFNWLLAVWGPAFSRLLAAEVGGQGPAQRGDSGLPPLRAPDGEAELQLGTLFQRALGYNLRVEGISFPRGVFRDLGTPAGLAAVQQWLAAGGAPAEAGEGS